MVNGFWPFRETVLTKEFDEISDKNIHKVTQYK